MGRNGTVVNHTIGGRVFESFSMPPPQPEWEEPTGESHEHIDGGRSLVTDRNWLPLAGIFTLCAGLVSVLAGLVCLGAGILKTVRAGVFMGRTVLVGMVLLVNFPVAGSILLAAANLAAAYKVIVRNHASAPIRLATLTGGGVSLQIGQIEPGMSITKRFHIAQDGTLIFSAGQSGKKLNVIVDDMSHTHSAAIKRSISSRIFGNPPIAEQDRCEPHLSTQRPRSANSAPVLLPMLQRISLASVPSYRIRPLPALP
jgi:hypothetical protein